MSFRILRPLARTISDGSPIQIYLKKFEQTLSEAVKAGFVDASAVFIDAKHIKANANNHKYTSEVVKTEVKHYQNELQKEIEKDREEHEKNRRNLLKTVAKRPQKRSSRARPTLIAGCFIKASTKRNLRTPPMSLVISIISF